MKRRLGSAVLFTLALALVPARPGASQTADIRVQLSPAAARQLETSLLRDAAALETRGDHAGAERVLRSLMDQIPTSVAALFALERALRSQERLAEVLPWVDGVLTRDGQALGVRSMKLRILVELDSLQTLERDVQEWIRSDPGSPVPYQEVARVYELAFGPERAIAFLREGRTHLEGPAAFAVELGDLLEHAGQPEAAAYEWSLALGTGDAAQTAALLRRVSRFSGDSGPMIPLLLEALDTPPTTPGRRRAAARIALEAALPGAALELARRALPELAAGERRAFLEEMGLRGEEMGQGALALWAFVSLRELAGDEVESRAIDERIASAALAVGDTSRALDARRRLASGLPVGSAERRRALVELVRLEARTADPDVLAGRLEAFRREFPDAPELDEMASAVAFGLQSRGHLEAAGALLEDVLGPRSSLERAYLHLDQGDPDRGLAALREAVGALPPSTATEVIQLVILLGRLGPAAGAVATRAAVLGHRGGELEAAEHLLAELPRLPRADQPPLLAHAARLADRGGEPQRAAQLRQSLLDQHAEAPEAADAALALARWLAQAGQLQEAVALLEALITTRPHSPVVPDARRELERLRNRGPGGPE